MNDDKELWLEFIKRDIPQWDQYDIPHESDSWYDIYCDLLEQVQREVEEGALQLKQAVDKFYSEKASHAAVLVKDTSRLPKPRRRFHHSAGRSEPKKAGIFSSKRNKVLAVPTHQLHNGASRINRVPQWLVDEHKHAPSSSTAPSASKHTSKPVNTTSGASSSSSTRVSAPRGRPAPQPTTPTKKENSSELPRGSRPIVPRKRNLQDNGPLPPTSTAAATTSVRTSSPVRPSPTTPGKTMVRKRPIASQPNIFIQQKKRKI